MSDYQRLDDDEMMNGIARPVRLNKPITIKMMKAKLSNKIDKAIGIMDKALSDDKKAYMAAKDIMNFYLQLHNMEMREELHNEEMKFKRYKNKINKDNVERAEAQDHVDSAGSTDIPAAKFSMDFDEFKPS